MYICMYIYIYIYTYICCIYVCYKYNVCVCIYIYIYIYIVKRYNNLCYYDGGRTNRVNTEVPQFPIIDFHGKMWQHVSKGMVSVPSPNKGTVLSCSGRNTNNSVAKNNVSKTNLETQCCVYEFCHYQHRE